MTLVPAVAAETATIAASRDATLYEDSTGGLSNGAGAGLFVGANNAGLARRGLVAFDIAGGIPAGSTIDSVTLSMRVTRTSSARQTIELHRVLADWGEGTSVAAGEGGAGATARDGDATWLHRFFDATAWNGAGGDFDADRSGTALVENLGPYTWTSTEQMVADVQGWLDNSASNYGWLLLGNELSTQTTKRFGSREADVASDRPSLTVEYTPPAGGSGTAPTPSAACPLVATAMLCFMLTALIRFRNER